MRQVRTSEKTAKPSAGKSFCAQPPFRACYGLGVGQSVGIGIGVTAVGSGCGVIALGIG